MRKGMQRWGVVLLLFGLTLWSWGTGHSAPRSEAGPSAVAIGVPLPLSGDLKAFGIMMKNSFEMALETVNESGGINGHPIKLVYGDDQGKAAQGVKVITGMIKDSKVVMLVGGYSSNATYAMAGEAEKLGVPFLICTASADKITQRSWENIYRLNPPISEYTKGLEDFWLKIYKPASVAIVYEDSMFGTNGMKRMMEFCRANGIDLQQIISYDKTRASTDYFRPLMALVASNPPEAVYMVSYLKDAVDLVRTIRALGIKSLLCGGAGGFTHEDFIKQAGEAANHVLTATLWFDGAPYPGAKEYSSQYVKRYGSKPAYHGAEAYSALITAADALKRAESQSPAAIRKALDKTYLLTPFGPVKFYSYYDYERQNSVRTQVLQVIGSKFQCVWPPDLATATFVPPPGAPREK